MLAENDLLFLDASVVSPKSLQAIERSSDVARLPPTGIAEISNAELHHRRLGHPGRTAMKNLVRLQKIPKEASEPLPDHCRVCLLGKAHMIPRQPQQCPASRCLERLHVDLMCKIRPKGFGGEENLLVVTDEFSGYVEAIPLVTKGGAPKALIDLVAVWENQKQPLRVTQVHSDQGGEFDNSVLDAWAARRGVTMCCSPAYTPKSNGRAERQNLALKELVIMLMHELNIPADLWSEVIRYGACYLLNRRPRNVSRRVQIPYEVFTNHAAQYKHLRIIGSPCEVTVKQKAPRPKFAPRTIAGILLGYVSDGRNNTCLYRVYVPSNRQVHNVVDVHILEPSRRALPHMPAPIPEAGCSVPGEDEEQARRAHASTWSPVTSSSPPQVSASIDRSGALTGGDRGPSTSGAHLPAPVMPHVTSMHDHLASPDTSGGEADDAGIPGRGVETRSLRPSRGVPAPRFDGSAAAIEVPQKFSPATCTLQHANVQDPGGSVTGDRNYLSEVEDVVGEEERAFDAARQFIAKNYCEVLSTEAAPKYQQSAPKTIQEALSRPDAPQWREACYAEMGALAAKEVMTLMMLPERKKAISLRWVFSYKLRPDGSIERYKARLVAKGFTQQEGIDFFEVWAPTGRLAAYRAMLAHAAYYGLEVKLLDFTTAFLNGPLEEEIYVKQPPGFEDGTRRVMRLNRALYGLKQAANAWHKAFVNAMIQIGYRRSVVDPAVFVRKCSKGVCIVHSHVDDCAGCGPPGEIDKDFQKLLSCFEGRELGEINGKVFLGIYHERDWDKNIIYLSQPRHIDTLLATYDVTSRPVRAPLDHKVVLLPTGDHDKQENPLLGAYAAIVGSVMYIANSTRPDLCYSASMLARFMANPSDAHLEQALRLLRYLLGSKQYRLALGSAKKENMPLVVWGDADFANCPETRRSVSGLVVQVHGSVVHWRSCKQPSVAKSTMIAEYYAASSAADECVYFSNLLTELGYDLGPTPLMCDNESAIHIVRNPVVNDRSKYAELHAHYVRERVVRGEIKVIGASTQDMVADCMTKALTPQKHVVACEMLGVVP